MGVSRASILGIKEGCVGHGQKGEVETDLTSNHG